MFGNNIVNIALGSVGWKNLRIGFDLMEGHVCIYSKEMVHSKVSQYFLWCIKLVFFKANVLPPLYWYKAK